MADQNKSIKEVWIPVLSLIVALAGVVGATFVQYWSGLSQARMKEYEVTFDEKHEGYTKLLINFEKLFSSAIRAEPQALHSHVIEIEAHIYSLEPFLERNLMQSVKEKKEEYSSFCKQVYLEAKSSGQQSPGDHDRNPHFKKYYAFLEDFRVILYPALFERRVEPSDKGFLITYIALGMLAAFGLAMVIWAIRLEKVVIPRLFDQRVSTAEEKGDAEKDPL